MSTSTPPSNPLHRYGQGSSGVRHSKEDALSERQFELLLEGARELSRSKFYYDADPELVVYVLGRLGLRRGELVHLDESWIDWRRQTIHIPAHWQCDRGQDGGPCGNCRQNARQRVKHADGDLDIETALEWMWAPKTQAGAREIYFGHDTRAELYLERYFESAEYTRFEASGSAVGRRVTRAAELADELDPESVYPHALRATSASHLIASLDVGLYGLMNFMGWEQISTAQHYISTNSEKTARQLEGY